MQLAESKQDDEAKTLTEKSAEALRTAIKLNPRDLRNYYNLARIDWASSSFIKIVTSLDVARGLGLDIDDDLQQFYQRSWKLISDADKEAHPMQYQPDMYGKPTSQVHKEGSLGADLEAALKGKGELADQLKQAQAEGGGSDTDLPTPVKVYDEGDKESNDKKAAAPKKEKEKKKKKEIGELTCQVCLRAVDNIYADTADIARQ